MKRLLTTACLLVIVVVCALAQSGAVRGKIVDAQSKEALEFVTVSVTKAGSTELLKGTVTDLDGNFNIQGLANGSYTLSVTFVGYKEVKKDFAISTQARNANLRTIAIREDSKMLSEVQVTGQRAQMKFEIDKKVFDVDQNIASTGGSASDVLTNIPSVEVDSEGEVSLRGSSSVTVWINGKASGLSADNRGEILEQLPAETIQKIEVITNPSAKFSPEGSAGIINIILKEDRKPGYYGSVQAGGDNQGGYNASGNINYSSGQLDAYANLGYRHREHEGGNESRREDPNGFLDQKGENLGENNNFFGRAGLTWHVTRADHFSANFMGMFGDGDRNNDIHYIQSLGLGPAPDQYSRFTTSGNDMRMMNFDVGYKHDFGEDHNIDFTLSHHQWNMDGHSEYRTVRDEQTASYQYQENENRSKEWEAQLDYVNKLSENHKIEAGYKGTFERENSPVRTYGDEAHAEMQQSLYNRFIYDQDIHALYATYSGRFGKLGYQVGVRGEYWKVNSESRSFDQEFNGQTPTFFEKDYFSLFPSLFLSYELPGGNELQLNYTRRLQRPWGGQLNSFRNITDSTNISYGNPELQPQYSNAYELNYIKNWENHTLSLSGYYRTTDDVIQRIRYREGNVMYSTDRNVTQSQSAGLEIVAKNKLTRAIDLTTTVNLFYYKLDGFRFMMAGQEVTGESDEDFSWNARMIANVILPYSFSLQVTGNYNARQVVAQGYRKANYSLDAGLRKSFWNKKLSLSINARDILDSRRWKTVTQTGDTRMVSENWRGGRRIGLTLTYSFGNLAPAKRKPAQRDNMLQDADPTMMDSFGGEGGMD